MSSAIRPNALATAVQEALEPRAARILRRPDLRPALRELRDYWRDKAQPNAEQLALLDFEFEQTAFCGILNTLNQDSKHPVMHAFGRFAHVTSGVSIPGTKHGHPNPDYLYWFAPVDGECRYVVTGQTGGAPPIAAEFSLLDKNQVYLGNLSLHQIVVGEHGDFTITLDPDPADGRPNHLQTKPGAFQLLVRNVISDLKAEQPMSFSFERPEAPPAAPVSDDEIARLCVPNIRKLIDDLMFVNANIVMTKPVNVFENPTIHDGGILSVSQAYAPGHFRLADDEALVFRLTLGNAAYAVVPVTNIWGGLGHYLDHIGSLGTGRALPNDDGSFTIVVSLKDPGIHNWVDPAGLHEGVIFVRWVGFDPAKKTDEKLTLDCRLVKLAELSAYLPAETRHVDASARRRQIEQHAADYLSATG